MLSFQPKKQTNVFAFWTLPIFDNSPDVQLAFVLIFVFDSILHMFAISFVCLYCINCNHDEELRVLTIARETDPNKINQQGFSKIAEMEQARSLAEQGMAVVRSWGQSIDLWVAKNVSKQNQTYLMFGLIVCMVLHLVYTKRKVQREVKEEEMAAKQNKKKN